MQALANQEFVKWSLLVVLVAGVLYGTSEPAHSGVTSAINLNGSASGVLSLDGSSAVYCTQSGGAGTGASWTAVPVDGGSPNGTFNFGTLSSGDGTLLTAQFAVRIRGNSTCHLTAVCNQATTVVPAAPNLMYAGVNITNAALLAGTIRLNNTVPPRAAGALADASAYSSAGSVFTSGNTLASLTNAAAPLTGSSLFCSFTSAPSLGGTTTGTNNYVEVYPLFTTNTGLAWGTSTGTASTGFTQTVVLGLFAN